MLKFQIGDMVTVDKFPKGHAMHGPWKIVARHYDQTEKAENHTYKVSRLSKHGTEARRFVEAALTLAREAADE